MSPVATGKSCFQIRPQSTTFSSQSLAVTSSRKSPICEVLTQVSRSRRAFPRPRRPNWGFPIACLILQVKCGVRRCGRLLFPYHARHVATGYTRSLFIPATDFSHISIGLVVPRIRQKIDTTLSFKISFTYRHVRNTNPAIGNPPEDSFKYPVIPRSRTTSTSTSTTYAVFF